MDHFLLALCELWRTRAVAHRSVELRVVRAREDAVQIAIARHANDLVRSGRPRDEVAPFAVRALEAQVNLQVVVQRDRLVRRLAPVRALGLDDALRADQPVRRAREPVCVLVHVQAG